MAISDALGERRTVRVPAGEIEYRDRGEGPPVVFVHGAAVNGDLWRRVAPPLAQDGHRTIVLDVPLGGHGIALDGEPDLSLFGVATIVADVIEALGLEGVTLVGNDTGGAVSQAVAARRPERLGRLVLTSCDAFDHFPPAAVAYLPVVARSDAAMALLIKAMRPRLVQRLPIAYGWATKEPIEPAIVDSFLHGLRTSAGVRRDFCRMLRAADKRDTHAAAAGLPAFDKPAAVIWAADDKFFPRADGEKLAELLPQAEFTVVEDSRTFIPEDRPERLVALLRAFLSR